MKKQIATLLCAVMAMGLMAGCGSSSSSAPAASTDTAAQSEAQATEDTAEAPEAEVADTALVYAVEAGSAGEAAAQENGFDINSVASQADALMEVAAGTSDAAIIDLLMAGAMIGEGTSYPDLTHTDELTTEEYGVGCRKGSDLPSFINQIFYETYEDGSMAKTATEYGVQEALVKQPQSAYEAAASDSDVEYIKSKGTFIVGITDFAPMDYPDDSGEWIGFDADMARIVANELGVKVEFVEIDWDNKILELDSKNIDAVWNGMTLTNEVMAAMDCSNPYCNNAQVIVIKK